MPNDLNVIPMKIIRINLDKMIKKLIMIKKIILVWEDRLEIFQVV